MEIVHFLKIDISYYSTKYLLRNKTNSSLLGNNHPIKSLLRERSNKKNLGRKKNAVFN